MNIIDIIEKEVKEKINEHKTNSEDAMDTVMKQCELWADTQIYNEE